NLATGAKAQLVEDSLNVVSSRMWAHAYHFGDFGVGVSLGKQNRNLRFTTREVRKRSPLLSAAIDPALVSSLSDDDQHDRLGHSEPVDFADSEMPAMKCDVAAEPPLQAGTAACARLHRVTCQLGDKII